MRGKELLGAALFIVGTSMAGCQSKSNPNEKLVGGVWFKSPQEGEIVTNPDLVLKARAYPAHPNDLPVDHVNFTAIFEGSLLPNKEHPSEWDILCTVTKPIENDIYECDADLNKLGVPSGGIVETSFDVYNTNGDKNLSPNGTKTFIYQAK